MFGMLARATLKPGKEAELQALLAEWRTIMRPKLPGSYLELVGNVAGTPADVIFVALSQDQTAFEQLSASPEQHAFNQKFNAVFEGEPTWEMISMEIAVQD